MRAHDNAAAQFRMRPGTRDGQPVEGNIIIPITFAPPPPAPPLTLASVWRGFLRNPVPFLLIQYSASLATQGEAAASGDANRMKYRD